MLPLKLKLLIEVSYKLFSPKINPHCLFLTRNLIIFVVIIFFIVFFAIPNQETLSRFTTRVPLTLIIKIKQMIRTLNVRINTRNVRQPKPHRIRSVHPNMNHRRRVKR
ncbi:hypothetical protein HanPSC8_Chr01g0000901 [Helianthus annuus]|nr:hypothetical protein HanPSC8_Chr01g0000901 [Helianthus annuus]